MSWRLPHQAKNENIRRGACVRAAKDAKTEGVPIPASHNIVCDDREEKVTPIRAEGCIAKNGHD